MEENSYKTNKNHTLFGQIERYLRLDHSKLHGRSSYYLLRLIFLLFLGLLYIWNTHFHENRLQQINQLQPIVADLRVKYMELQSSYMFASKQSEVAKRVAPLGIQESKVPPYTIQANPE